MVREIMRDPIFFAQKSEDATEADQQVVTDLLDTLRANPGSELQEAAWQVFRLDSADHPA